MRKTMSTLVVFGMFVSIGGLVQAAGPHPIAQPYGSAFELGEPSFPVDREYTRIPTDHLGG